MLSLAAAAAGRGTLPASVKLGDAVPAIIRVSDLERLKRALDLDRFSVVAAVRLGAEEGREAIVVEPLSDKALALVEEGCGRGDLCPDRLGFVAARIRIVLLQGNNVLTLVTIDHEARGVKGRLFEPRALRGGEADPAARADEAVLLGWSGWAEAAGGHVALHLQPLFEGPKGRLLAGAGAPHRVQWNDRAGRFQLYECVYDADEEPGCRFEDEIGE
ncbi:MAG TPA: hypothetical protein VFT43_14730 [Candidatus Polarisedimenticolia bacterium]|nr:hypothetical protein [Candidatus Polarisedimenticolia bacterium]